MRTLPSELEDHLLSGTTTVCNCWKITRRDGTSQGFTDHDEALSFGGVSYEAETGFVGSESLSRIGLSVDNMEVHSALSSGRLEEKDLSNGLYDNARVELYLVNWQSPEQHIIIRSGNIGQVKRGALSFMAEVRGLAHHLQQPQGRLFQSTCDAQLGDERCTINLDNASFHGTASVTSVDEDQSIETDGLGAFESNWFVGGHVEWLTGGNVGAVSEVKSQLNIVNADITTIALWQQLSIAPAIGDGFKIIAGCDKRFSTCRSKFNNQKNFRGFPHIPGNDFVISTPK